MSTRRARALVNAIALRHFNEKPRHVVQRAGGLTNTVFEFRIGHGDYVLRLHEDPTRIHAYFKEQWAMEHARQAGVPTPRVLEVGNDAAGFPYMIVEKVNGIEASNHPRRLDLVREMGSHAARLHTIRTNGFGEVFDWSSNRLSRRESWHEYLMAGLDVDRRVEMLKQHSGISKTGLARLENTVDAMKRWKKRPVLQHGDLRLKNVIVARDSATITAVIDWDNCLSGPPPFWDLSIALHDLGPDQKEAFLDGYGIRPQQFALLAPFLTALNLLNYAHVLVRLAERKERARLAWYRLRLQGLLDMHFA